MQFALFQPPTRKMHPADQHSGGLLSLLRPILQAMRSRLLLFLLQLYTSGPKLFAIRLPETRMQVMFWRESAKRRHLLMIYEYNFDKSLLTLLIKNRLYNIIKGCQHGSNRAWRKKLLTTLPPAGDIQKSSTSNLLPY